MRASPVGEVIPTEVAAGAKGGRRAFWHFDLAKNLANQATLIRAARLPRSNTDHLNCARVVTKPLDVIIVRRERGLGAGASRFIYCRKDDVIQAISQICRDANYRRALNARQVVVKTCCINKAL